MERRTTATAARETACGKLGSLRHERWNSNNFHSKVPLCAIRVWQLLRQVNDTCRNMMNAMLMMATPVSTRMMMRLKDVC